MKRPSFQFYPADWRNNAKLRRCSEAARGAWVDVLCLLHDSDEYGVCRWPLDELARAAGVPLKLVKELVAKDVLKGADKNAQAYIHTPRHAGKAGEPVSLVEASEAPCWYSSRFVRDEWMRQRRGQSTRFGTSDDAPKSPPKQTPTPAPNPPSIDDEGTTKPLTNDAIGEASGDGSTSSSTSKNKRLKPLSGNPDAFEVLDYLNARTGRAYQAVDANLKLIAGRLTSASVDQCKAVIDARVAKWGSDAKMDEYLRPKTIFNATNFAQYVGELGAPKLHAVVPINDPDAWRNDPKFRGCR